jgi:tRNA-Thr(GGU) m(6)t(6)A37 methyltransferase TsaA
VTDATDRAEGEPRATAYPVRAIGHVHSSYSDPGDVVHAHDRWTGDTSRIQLLPQHAGGLRGLEGYSHVIVLFWVHRARQWKMPRGHHKPPHVKVFATRMPVRPNPIGLSVVELLGFSPETGEVVVRGLDAVNGTPVLDLKPYIPNFDSLPAATVPEWVAEHLNSHFHAGHVHEHHPKAP